MTLLLRLLPVLFVINVALRAQHLERRSGHPYLLYTGDRVEQLKERIKSEEILADAWERMLASAEEAAEQEGRKRLRRDTVEELCLAYRMTKESRFAERVREWLFDQYTEDPRTDTPLMKRVPPWNSGLGTGEAAYHFAIAYDSVYDFLKPKERKELAARFAEKGILVILNDWVLGGERIHSLDTMGHNWWSAIVFGAGVGAMAILDEDPRAEAWVRRINDASIEYHRYAGSALSNKPATFDPAGGFYESLNYAGFAVRTYLPFRMAWENAFVEAPPELPVLDGLDAFFIHGCYPNSDRLMSVDFGDSSNYLKGAEPMRMLWISGQREANNLWYLSEVTGQAAETLFTESPRDLLYAPTPEELARVPEKPNLSTAMLYDNMGWALMRSSWEKDATFLAARSGFSWNHAHADAGSFVLYHKGKYMLIDSGHSSYPSAEYDDYFRQSVAHNVVLFNGMAENPENTYFGSVKDGTMSHLLDDGDFRYVLADATGPTSQYFARNYRSFLWIGDVILVIDDVKSFEPGQFEWQLHYNGEGSRPHHDIDFHVNYEGTEVLVRPLFPMTLPIGGLPTDYPENMRVVEKVGYTPVRGEKRAVEERSYHAFQPAELSRREKFITAILPLGDEGREGAPTIERLQGIDWIGLRIRQSGTVTEVYMNLLADGRIRHRNANLVLDNGWETDAYLFAFTYPEEGSVTDPSSALRTAVINGSYLRRGDWVALDSLSKVFLTASRGERGLLEVQLQGQPYLNVGLGVAVKPDTVLLNGEHFEAPYDAKGKRLQLRLLEER
ncbi:heparinase II/III family protein [Pelagicoccus enzymogenes]|uniref:heparinase II/III domain-containing protein n=1 Tax=Pelagicoccus enzymogenes TaxID=2773457 RepID=UPI00280F833A|nr:heparinase II/III family protein [Pelagicoccus enzymogenes]MDQ8197863.1 heparinase II/III family protein [Pelagicoccus enzymogenes]